MYNVRIYLKDTNKHNTVVYNDFEVKSLDDVKIKDGIVIIYDTKGRLQIFPQHRYNNISVYRKKDDPFNLDI